MGFPVDHAKEPKDDLSGRVNNWDVRAERSQLQIDIIYILIFLC